MYNQNCNYERCFEFDFIDENIKAPKFTKKNLALINTFLRYNSSYSAAENKEEGSYAAILEDLKEDFFDFDKSVKSSKKHKKDDYDEDGNLKDNLYRVIESIDRMNSTHLASEGQKTEDERKNNIKKNKGRVKTAKKIREIKDFKTRLKDGDTNLIHEIASAGGKYNFSFATKFCAYVSRHVWGEKNNKYCIYDEVVQSILPYYIYHYVNPNNMEEYCRKNRNGRVESLISNWKTEDGYEKYINIINEIIEGIKREDKIDITYEQFDHMLWYYFKGSKTKIQEALNSIELN